jgi:DNA repair protein RadC
MALVIQLITRYYSKSYSVMRIAKYVVIASTGLVLSLSAMAQDVQHNRGEGQLVAANAELVTKIDAKTAKAGDVVTAKLTSSVRLSGGTELKHNTLLTGHIDQVQAAGNDGTSTVVLTF